MIGIALSDGELARASDELIREVLTELSGAVHDETRGLELDLEQITRLAVKGKLWRAWKSEAFPKNKGAAREPSGSIFVNGGRRSQGAIAFFTREGRIANGGGFYLAIPTAAAGPKGRARDLTPGEWEWRNGQRLRFVYRKGRPSLLVADAGTLNGRTGSFRPITRKRTAADGRRGFARGEQTVPIFVLLPYVDFQPRFAIEPLVARRERMLADNIGRRLQQYASF
jgi:hypothetical protein